MTYEAAIRAFKEARVHYCARHFDEARLAIQRYIHSVNYADFKRIDNRPSTKPTVSVIIVAYATGPGLLDCINSVFMQEGPVFEIILVDNGGNKKHNLYLASKTLLWVATGHNLLPSEGRNVGAHFARGEYLVFLDDDAIMCEGYLAEAYRVLEDNSVIALRGRVLPKLDSGTNLTSYHYDLGNVSIPSELNLEGNMVIRNEVFRRAGRFDPLMFGHEGKELTSRCRLNFPKHKILYCPKLIIKHDWAENKRLTAKRERQAIGMNYQYFLKEQRVIEGISILVRAYENLSAADDFLMSLVKHNSYRPIEVFLWANNSQGALTIAIKYLTKFLVRVLPTSTKNFERISKQFRYDKVLIVDLPVKLSSDLLSEWRKLQQTFHNFILACNKHDILAHKGIVLTIDLVDLAAIVEKTASIEMQNVSANLKCPKQFQINNAKSSIGIGASQKIPENKNLLRHTNKRGRLIAGMATIPSRLPSLPRVLDRLKKQFDSIYIYFNGHEEIPKCLIGDNVKYAWSKYHGDLAASGKFYFLDQCKQNDYYFTLDDDFLYPKDYSLKFLQAFEKYCSSTILCIHGSIFGDPLDWYFERTKVYGSKEKLVTDKFVNLVGTGTFACQPSVLNLEFCDFYPKVMCDLQVSVKARQLGVPAVSLAREAGWLRTVKQDKNMEAGNDYWTRMLIDDDGRTELAKSQDWSFASISEYVMHNIGHIFQNKDKEYLVNNRFDIEFIEALRHGCIPVDWSSDSSLLFYKRKYQYYNLLRLRHQLKIGNIDKINRSDVLIKIDTEDIFELKSKIDQVKEEIRVI